MACWNISPCLSPKEANVAVGHLRTALNVLDDEPIVDAKEVVHAKWEWFDVWECDDTFGKCMQLRCSNCLESEGARENAKYCSNCGAMMDLE